MSLAQPASASQADQTAQLLSVLMNSVRKPASPLCQMISTGSACPAALWTDAATKRPRQLYKSMTIVTSAGHQSTLRADSVARFRSIYQLYPSVTVTFALSGTDHTTLQLYGHSM